MDGAALERLATAFTAADPCFPRERFLRLAGDGLEALELKARMSQVADALAECLPADFAAAAKVVERVVAARSADQGSGLGTWELWPVNDWVAMAGLDDPGLALQLLADLTPLSSAEFAVRPFIDQDPDGTLARLRNWLDSPDEHVRRLVSEGTRPRLPWAPRLAVARNRPDFAVELLDGLLDDPSEYVRRSVANHLNDICRCDRDLGLEVARRWGRGAALAETDDPEAAARIGGVLVRGLRSLVKAGDPEALALLGHDPSAEIHVEAFEVAPERVHIGDHAVLRAVITSREEAPQDVVLDYAIGFPRADGGIGRRVFKWRTVRLEPGATVELTRRHRMAEVTIRTTRPGTHPVELQVNGRVAARGRFELVPA